jgi:ribonuclease HI
VKTYLYTDGSCYHKDELGTWGAVIVTPAMKKMLWGVCYATTISRMELVPMIEGMRWILKEIYHNVPGAPLCIVSDSQYTIKVASGLDHTNKNQDLWKAFEHMASKFKVTYEWRSRNSCVPLEICDSCAGALRTYVKSDLYKGMTEMPLCFNHES